MNAQLPLSVLDPQHDICSARSRIIKQSVGFSSPHEKRYCHGMKKDMQRAFLLSHIRLRKHAFCISLFF